MGGHSIMLHVNEEALPLEGLEGVLVGILGDFTIDSEQQFE